MLLPVELQVAMYMPKSELIKKAPVSGRKSYIISSVRVRDTTFGYIATKNSILAVNTGGYYAEFISFFIQIVLLLFLLQ